MVYARQGRAQAGRAHPPSCSLLPCDVGYGGDGDADDGDEVLVAAVPVGLDHDGETGLRRAWSKAHAGRRT